MIVAERRWSTRELARWLGISPQQAWRLVVHLRGKVAHHVVTLTADDMRHLQVAHELHRQVGRFGWRRALIQGQLARSGDEPFVCTAAGETWTSRSYEDATRYWLDTLDGEGVLTVVPVRELPR